MKTLEIFSVYDQDVETGPTDIAPCGSSSNEGQELKENRQWISHSSQFEEMKNEKFVSIEIESSKMSSHTFYNL